jgi:hypothetical protein
MHTIAELIKDMSHSSLEGVFGVAGVIVFLCAIVAAAFYRIREIQKSEHHH